MRSLVAALDSVAALREGGGAGTPRLPVVAMAAEVAGVDAVRVGASESLRPVAEDDLYALRSVVRRLELRLAPTPSLLKLALEVRPDRVILSAQPAPNRFDAPPLDPTALRNDVPSAVRALAEAGIPAVVRVAPDVESIKAARGAEIAGVEIGCMEALEVPDANRAAALAQFSDAARLAAKLRVPVGAAGLLEARGLRALLEAAPVVESVAVGRELVARSLLVGMDRAVGELRAALA